MFAGRHARFSSATIPSRSWQPKASTCTMSTASATWTASTTSPTVNKGFFFYTGTTIMSPKGRVSFTNPAIYNLIVLQPPIMCLSLSALTQCWNPWLSLGWFAVVACFWALISVAIPPLLQWATATRTWWGLELSKCNSSTPTRVSCMTIWSCTPRGCRPPYLTSCLCATLSTQGASSAHSSNTHRRHVRRAAHASISSLRYLMRRQINVAECVRDPVRLLIDTWCWSLNWGYLPSVKIQIIIPTKKRKQMRVY